MKGFLTFIGVLTLIGSAIATTNGFYTLSIAQSAMHQITGVNYLTFGGVLLLISVVAFGCNLIPGMNEIRASIKFQTTELTKIKK